MPPAALSGLPPTRQRGALRRPPADPLPNGQEPGAGAAGLA